MRQLLALCVGLSLLMAAATAYAEERWVCYKVTNDFRSNSRKTMVDIVGDAIGRDGEVLAKTNKAKLVCVKATSGVLNGSEGESEATEQ